MKMTAILSLISSMLLIGCVSSHQAVSPNIKEIKLPDINNITESSLGERLLESGRIVTIDGFNLNKDVNIFDGTVKSGEYHQIGVTDIHKVFGPAHGYGTGIVGAISGIPSPAKPYVDGNTGYLCFLGGFGTRFCSDNVKPIIMKVNLYTADSFMQELIYTGKVGNKIRFTYREFQNGMARQAFNIDVEYDLSEGNLISYKGATVEIISATNQRIQYRVLKHFN